MNTMTPQLTNLAQFLILAPRSPWTCTSENRAQPQSIPASLHIYGPPRSLDRIGNCNRITESDSRVVRDQFVGDMTPPIGFIVSRLLRHVKDVHEFLWRALVYYM